jgi:hypothetical protein
MILSNAHLNTATYLRLERYVNDGSPSGFSQKFTTSPETCPGGPNGSFHLCSIELPNSIDFEDIGEQPRFFKQWQMLVHPDMIDDAVFSICTNIDRRAVLVCPTASGRTVKMLDDEGWFIKLSYKGLIGRIDRQLGLEHAHSAVEVSQTIVAAINAGQLPKSFHLLREVFARVVRLPSGNSTYDWGIVLRDPVPFPTVGGVGLLVPGFSLFSRDEREPNDTSILCQLIAAQRKKTEDFLFEDLIAPAYDAYFTLLLNCGLQIEAQAQNILYTIDSNLHIGGLVLRDAESVDKDLSLMAELGIKHNFVCQDYKCLLRGQHNYQIMHSFMFDFKLGEYLVSPIIAEAAKHFTFDIRQLQERVRDHNRRWIDRLPSDFFPPDGQWYSYANVVHDRAVQRPYIANPNPKYR